MTLALLHTTAVTVPTFKELAAQHLPGVRVINLLDDSLLADVMSAGQVTPAVQSRLQAYTEQALVAGAEALMSCCSSIGEAVERIRGPIPTWRIDQAMAEEAAGYTRVGVLATVRTTLEPTVNLIRRQNGKAEVIESLLVEGAFQALQEGRPEEHDRLVGQALDGLLQRSDVVVLAQASMARLLQGRALNVPVLTSPVPGLQAAARRLRN